jgi:hypothetical protein
MPTLVLRLGSLPVAHEEAQALVALKADGSIDLAVESSVGAAAEALASRLEGGVVCEEALAFVGKRWQWRGRTLSHDELVFRATLALSIVSRFPPTWQLEVKRLVEAWCAFWPLQLWEQLPSEMGLPLRRTKKPTEPAVSVLGKGGREFGAAVYDSTDDFHLLFGQGVMRGQNRSVMAEPGVLDEAFGPLGVPCPSVVTTKGMAPRKPTRDDLLLLAGALELLVGVVEGTVETTLKAGDVLSFRREAPGTTPQAPAKPRRRRTHEWVQSKPPRRPKKKK